MPIYKSITYHDVNASKAALEFEATRTWVQDTERMGFSAAGGLTYDVEECKLPTGQYVIRVVTSGEYERDADKSD